MSVTTYQQFTKPEDREELLELFLRDRFEEFGAVFGNAFIEGLQLEWVSASSIRVKTGAADIPDGSRRLRVTAAITVASISLGNNAWGHIYLYSNAGVPAVEVVTTAPASYFGSAYQKTAVSTRRYLGSVRTNGSGNIFKFMHQGDTIYYLEDTTATPFRVLSTGTATTETSVSCSNVVPATSQVALARFANTEATAAALIGNSLRVSATNLIRGLIAGADDQWPTPLNSSQALTYKFGTAPAGTGLYCDVQGYRMER